MVNCLKKQTELDEEFRNNKLWFESVTGDDKWKKLEAKLAEYRMKMPMEQIKSVFTITDEENNPFFSVRESSSDMDRLVDSYQKTEEHWRNSVVGRFSR